MRLILLLLMAFCYLTNYSQTTSSSYNSGDIPTSFNVYDGTCNGPNATIIINIPAGDEVTAVDVSYDMTAGGVGWMSEQRSQIYCQESNTDEGGYASGSGSSGGTMSYNRNGLSLANGISATGVLTFEMRAYRTYEGSAGCLSTDNKVDNGTWTITVHHHTPANMTYVSSTASQPNTSDLSPSSTNQEIIQMQVEVSGTVAPIDVTQFVIGTNGTTDINDVSNVQIWYTGTSNTYATTTLFGGTTTLVDGGGIPIDLNITGTQTLVDGINYFWLSYDISASATSGHVVDAEFLEVTVDGSAETPTVTAPVGSRPINITYCASNATNSADSEIDEVVLNGDNININNNTAGTCAQYSDFTALAAADLSINSTYQIDLIIGTCGGDYNKGAAIFIDWNKDGDFDDTDETIGSVGSNTATSSYNLAFTVPSGASLGDTRLRIVAQETGTPASISSCGTYGYGETEDYTITVLPEQNMSFVSCTASQPNTSIVSLDSYNQEIIRIEVVTSGTLTPINSTEFRLRTDGTDNYLTDIENARLWYTGNNDVFTASTQFGTTVVPVIPGNDMVFSGTQSLASGSNYFWLTYNIPSTATVGNFVDATFQTCVVDGNTETPVTSNPTGEREIMDGCYHYLNLYDQGANGWEGGSITVQVDGINVLSNVTLASGSETTHSFIAAEGKSIETFYTAGTNASENRYTITNTNDAFVLSDGTDNMVPGAGLTDTADCTTVPNYTPNGSSYQTDTDCFVITEDKIGESGSVWYNYMVSLTTDFQIEFDIYIGDKDVTMINDGADGMTFALQGECSASGGDGSSMGYGGITPSIAVEFDSYRNSVDNNDPVADHIAIVSNGDVNHASANNLAGPVDIAAGFEDDNWHNVRISWANLTNTFNVYFDGTLVISYTGDIVNNIFGGKPIVYWGFTGGTGLYFNRQEVCVTSYPTNSTALSDVYCDVCSEQVQLSQGATSYTWTPNDGSIDDPTIYNPTFTPTTTTEYTVVIEDACGNLITDRFTIHVTLPVELTKFKSKCIDEGTLIEWETSSETNNQFFALEKSYDALNFFEISRTKGAGNSNQTMNYDFLDKEATNELVYYRLAQYDYDGSIEYSNIISQNCKQKHINVDLYPNPAKGHCEIQVEDYAFEYLKYEIFNTLGQKVSHGTSQTTTTKIALEAFSKGLYLVVIEIDQNLIKKNLIIH